MFKPIKSQNELLYYLDWSLDKNKLRYIHLCELLLNIIKIRISIFLRIKIKINFKI